MIMGLSGSGKSTLVRCLSRLIESTAGEIDFDGADLLAASEKELIELRRHKMGIVFQHFALFPHRTVLENVAFPLEVRGVDRAEREARAAEIIKLVTLEGRENFSPVSYPGASSSASALPVLTGSGTGRLVLRRAVLGAGSVDPPRNAG